MDQGLEKNLIVLRDEVLKTAPNVPTFGRENRGFCGLKGTLNQKRNLKVARGSSCRFS